MSFRIHNVSDKEINLTVVSAPNEVISYKIPDKIKAGTSKLCEVRLTEAGKSAEWSKSLTLELDDEYTTRLSIPITREIRSTTVTPASSQVDRKEGT